MVQMARQTAASQKKAGLELRIQGIVQGVGFRPFIFHLAQKHNVRGWVRNESDGVLLAIEGDTENLDAFMDCLIKEPPPLAKITGIRKKSAAFCGYQQFTIHASESGRDEGSVVPPDIATCRDCLEDIAVIHDRHYHYPFTNCTNCGPRFTITGALPYDRINTSMQIFPTCEDCSAEYENPADRRYHAQPVACPACGPCVQVLDRFGKTVAGDTDWLHFFWSKIGEGKIFAVKSLGGYHLACSVREDVVNLLRQRKNRPAKPFALLCRDLEAASRYCHFTRQEASWLTSPTAPIILLPTAEESPLPANINPGLSSLGVMLPYTPLHHMIMKGPFDVLVMTSANPTGLPMIKDDAEALQTLQETADYFLSHNRGIVQRCDDSVARVIGDRIQLHRRSRGFTPSPIEVNFDSESVILGAGAEMKNSFCLIKGKEAYFSQHLGEIETVEAEQAYWESLHHYIHTFKFNIALVAYDMHPEYRISAIAREIPAEKYYGIYHHHAHFTSCLAENNHVGKAIGVILDGTGYGDDGAVWGFEILSGDYLDFTREFSQRYIPLSGGESAVKWPWRMALSYLYQAMGSEGLSIGERLFGQHFEAECALVSRQLEQDFPMVPSSSCGRLFDAVSAILGICYHNTYEGQGAVQLSEILRATDLLCALNPYPYLLKDNRIDFYPMFPELLADLKHGKEKILLARRFHDTVVQAILEAVDITAAETGLQTVALSGGAWHNPYLVQRVRPLLEKKKYKVMLHGKVPPNDGGLALGQAVSAYWRCKEDVPGFTDGC